MHREMPTNVLLAHVLLWFAWLLLGGHVLLSPFSEVGAGEFLFQHMGEVLALVVMVVANLGVLFRKPWARALLVAGLFAGALLLFVALIIGSTQLRGTGRLVLIALASSGVASYLLVSGSGASWFAERSRENAL